MTSGNGNLEKQLCFLYSGHGSEYQGMTRVLRSQFPLYSKHLDSRIEKADSITGGDLRSVLFGDQRIPVEFSGAALLAVQDAFTATLADLGVTPDSVLGHSVGEYAAACAAGVFDFETALAIVHRRGQLLSQTPSGRMAAVALTVEEAERYISPKVVVAATNGPGQCVLTGDRDSILKLAAELEESEVFCKVLSVDMAAHSPLLDSILEPFGDFLRQFSFEEPRVPLISGLTGVQVDEVEICCPEYWVRQLREPVRFAEALQKNSSESWCFLAVGPSGPVPGLVDSCARSTCLTTCPSRSSQKDSLQHLEAAVAEVRSPRETRKDRDSRVFEVKGAESELELVVGTLFCQTLGLAEVDVNANFLELGGNSLIAMQVISRLREYHDFEISVPAFFARPTVRAIASGASVEPSEKPISRAEHERSGAVGFSLFFFAADEDRNPKNRYKTVLEAAQFADRAGFEAVWLPERHFNRFGGLYPNPAVLGAAIAAVTDNLSIRAGSVVAPLHHPVRIVEEWSAVDNLSQGRVGVAFASGFHPKDFLLAPEAFPNRKERMFQTIETVRELWAGGSFSGVAGNGEAVEVRAFPGPYSPSLPIWLATSRSKETFREAGEIGAGVLTALLRLSVEELAERIAIYREALKNSGRDPESGKVTVMLHTYLAQSLEEARNVVETPLKNYLRSHLEHTRAVSEEKATDAQLTQLASAEEEELLEFSFRRYLNERSLVGTEESCLDVVRKLQAIGVDEVACLVDFGLEDRVLLSGLHHLEGLKDRAEEQVDFPQSFAQQRLWFLEEMEAEHTAYHLPFAFRIRGELNTEALFQALNSLVKRHEAFRTSFHMVQGQPIQRVREHLPLELPIERLHHLQDDEAQQTLERIIFLDMATPFDLAGDTLLRARLLQFSETDHVLVLVAHHIATDDWSMKILWRELDALYGLFTGRATRTLEDLRSRYVRYSRVQNQDVESARWLEQLRYWKKQLQDLPDMPLPTTRPRPNFVSHDGREYRFVLPPELVSAARQFARDQGVTLFLVLLSAMKSLLARYCDSTDIALGVPVAGREHPNYESLVGIFINTLVVRTQMAGEPDFRTVVKRVKKTMLEALDNQNIPFEKLVEELQPVRHVNRAPLVQVIFQLLDSPTEQLEIEGLDVSPEPIVSRRARFDLEFKLWESEEGIAGSVVYSTALFEEWAVASLWRHFENFLGAALENPEQSYSHVDYLDQKEKLLFQEWNDTATELPREHSLYELFLRQVERTPGATALLTSKERLTYQELEKKADRLAQELLRTGTKAGEIIAFCLSRSVDAVVSILAILKIGCAYLPLSPEDPGLRLARLVEKAGVAAVVCSRETSEPFADEALILEELESKGSCEETLPVSVPSSSRAYVMFTSGSTGLPKGVEVSHLAVARLVLGASYARFGPDRRFLQLAPLSFDASIFEIWGALLHGSTLVIPPSGLLDLREIGNLVQENKISTLWLTSTLFNQMVDTFPESLSGVEELLVGGEQLSPRHIQKVRRYLGTGTSLINGYGPTESTTFATTYTIPYGWGLEPVPIGRPVSNTQCYVLDSHQELLPVGVPGELCLAGEGLAIGYLGESELNGEKFVNTKFGRLYRTGDRCLWHTDGNLRYLGRIDHQLKIRGFRVEPGEIESALRAQEEIADCAVRFWPGPGVLSAYLVSCSKNRVEPGELKERLFRQLPPHMVPQTFAWLSELPVSRSGKVDYLSLPSPNFEDTKAGGRPRDELERQLLTLWEEHLNIESLGIDSNFFELGGHSLLALRMVAETEKILGLSVRVGWVFEAPTVRAFAGLLRQLGGKAESSCLVQLQKGRLGPLVLIPPASGTAYTFSQLTSHLGAEVSVFSFNPLWTESGLPACTTVEDMAEEYLKALLETQPNGPYYLGGLCFGGHVALEMAQRLRRRGKDVRLVAIIDSTKPASGPTWQREEAERDARYFMGRLVHHLREGTFNRVVRARTRAGLRKLNSRFRELSEDERFDELLLVQLRAGETYKASPYEGRLDLFLTEEFANTSLSPDFWESLAMAGATRHLLPGATHQELAHSDEVIGRLADLLKCRLIETCAELRF